MGADRYDASAQISQSLLQPGRQHRLVSWVRCSPDASGAPWPGSRPRRCSDIDDHLPSRSRDELDRLLNPKRIVVLGGPNSVSDAVLAQLTTFTGSWVPRWFGADRYEASAQISAESFAPGVLGGPMSPMAGLRRCPLAPRWPARTRARCCLSAPTRSPSSIRSELLRLRPHKIVVLGGPASISTSLEGNSATTSCPDVHRRRTVRCRHRRRVTVHDPYDHAPLGASPGRRRRSRRPQPSRRHRGRLPVGRHGHPHAGADHTRARPKANYAPGWPRHTSASGLVFTDALSPVRCRSPGAMAAWCIDPSGLCRPGLGHRRVDLPGAEEHRGARRHQLGQRRGQRTRCAR